jgi:anti-anti-sigma factor
MIDLTELEFCDSTGLRALVGAVREVEVGGGKAALAVKPGSALDRLLELTGLSEFTRIADTPTEALRRLGAA